MQMSEYAAILPVLDLLHGQIVRGIAGRRAEYRPIQSKLTASAEPLAVANAMRDHFGFTEFYLADLDAIQFGRPNRSIYDNLQADGFHLWIDAGLRGAGDAVLEMLEGTSIIVGLESVDGPEALQRIVGRIGGQALVFSVDLKEGKPLGPIDRWPSADPWLIAIHAVEELGVRRVIVLDLAKVGVGEGVGTEALCARLKQAYPEVQLTAGGGVRGIDDVNRLVNLGVDRVLVASALHDGRIRG
jgi:phosphoribosylformimino-5-aminoimidazole carboxamide ribotide isomerase